MRRLRIIDLTRELPLNQMLDQNLKGGHPCSKPYSGSFIESPSYMFEEGKRLQDFPVAAFVVGAVVLDLSDRKRGRMIDDEDFEDAEESSGLAVRQGEVVVLYTGDGKEEGSHPAISENGAQYLEFKGISGVASDLPCLDANQELVAHSVLMRKGIFVIENLCNLGEISQPRIRLVALPTKIRGSRSPVRVIAILTDD